MRLLICTQAVDRADPVLGFFHGWIEGLAKRVERVHVVCLREGEHTLPANVAVHSLGKESGRSLFKYVSRFYFHIWKYRNEYDAVFVHMNEEYVLLAGLLWRSLGKRVVLWRNHKVGSWRTRLAGSLAHAVCYTSPSAYVASFPNAVRMPIGIDTNVFKPSAAASGKSGLRNSPSLPAGRQGSNSPRPDFSSASATGSVLFLGRLDAVKKPDILLESIALLRKRGNVVPVRVVGDPTPGRERYAEELKSRFGGLADVSFERGVRNDETPGLYASHTVYVNLTPSGSFDKTIGEAAASGCIVVAANEVLRGIVPDTLIVDSDSPESVAEGIAAALALDGAERKALSARLREYVEKEHSLTRLFDTLIPLFRTYG